MSFESTLDESFVLAPTAPIENVIEKVSSKPVKRPHNAYNLFFIERNPIEREKHQLLSGNEVSQLIGKIWHEMSDEEKKPYKMKAEMIRQQFKEENPDYHYQKASDKPKKKKVHLPSIAGINLNNVDPGMSNISTSSSIPFETQLKNMLSSLGQQIVLRYLEQNKSEMDGMIKNSQITINETIETTINGIDAPVLNQ